MKISQAIVASALLLWSAMPAAYAEQPASDENIYLIYLPSELKTLGSYAAQIGCMSREEALRHAPAAEQVLDANRLTVGRLEREPFDLTTILMINGDSSVVLAKGDCADRIKKRWENGGISGVELKIVTLVEERDSGPPSGR